VLPRVPQRMGFEPLVSLSGVDWAEPVGAKVQGANMVDR
jgi:hypothetical protein